MKWKQEVEDMLTVGFGIAAVFLIVVGACGLLLLMLSMVARAFAGG